MKKSLLLCFGILMFQSLSFAVHPTATNASDRKMSDSFWSQLSDQELLTLSPKEIKQKTGEKLKFKERLALKIGRKAYKKAQRKLANAGESQYDKTSVASFIFSTLGLLSFLIPFLFGLFAIVGFILGIIALTRKGNYDVKKGKGFAIAGTIIGGLWILLVVILIAGLSAL